MNGGRGNHLSNSFLYKGSLLVVIGIPSSNMAQSRHRVQTLSVHNHFRNVRLFKEQELGHGAFATVCRAACDSLLCAAKVLHPEFFDQGDPGEENFVAKFIEECNILPSITHPNIVQCFGTYQDPETDLPVLLMELMDESLTDYLERAREPLPFHAEVSFSYDVALGLSYLHSRGYIHRDLSSNNVLIMAGVRAKITDFGMCRATTGPRYLQSRLTQCPGTQVYMPPEALVEHPVYTAKLDVFSYGVLMIQIMSRQFPKPGPAHRMLPSGLFQAIPEVERRANHIKYVNIDHQMLPLAKRCIQNSHSLRPSSDEICSALSSLKESQYYQQSKDEDSVELKLESAKIRCREVEEICNQLQHELGKREMDHEIYCQRVQSMHLEEIERIKTEHSEEIESIHFSYQLKLHVKEQSYSTIQTASLPFDPSTLPEPAFGAHEFNTEFETICPSNLPEPAFDVNDLELLHQEVLLSSRAIVSGENVKEAVCVPTSSNIGQNLVVDTSPCLAGQTVASSSPVPKPRPRSFSGGKKLDALKSDPKSTSVPEGVKPTPRPRSPQNLLSTKVSTPPRSPQHNSPTTSATSHAATQKNWHF